MISDLAGPPGDPARPDVLDPTTGTWSRVEALNAPRSEFVAVVLHDGRVLVTGGNNGWDGAYSSTKLLDPATGRWTSTGLLNTARILPIGALLPDGRVLVAGGTYSEGYRSEEDFNRARRGDERELRTAELYDPATERWRETASLHHVESAGGAFALPDGTVLAAGLTCELYDPRTETWTDVEGCPEQPDRSAAVVLEDGSLLVIGGQTEVPGAADGSTQETYPALATVTRFEPSRGASTRVASLPAPRTGAAAVRLADGRVLVAGGAGDGYAAPTSTTFIYDPAIDTWTESTPMPFADFPGAAVLLSDGRVLVTGGLVPVERQATDVPWADPVGWTAVLTLGPRTDR